jgi:F0F1-type ATP synthase membrane subunit c/vacuolar-type H+-ATPase subunit K
MLEGVDLYGISLSKYPSASIEVFGKMVILLQVLMTESLSLFLVNSFSLIDKQRNVRNQGVVKAALNEIPYKSTPSIIQFTDLAEHKDISTETILLNYNYKKNRTITVRLSNLTRGTIPIPQKAIISLSKYPSASIEVFGKMVILLQVLMTESLSLFLVNSFSLIDKQRNERNQGVVKAAFCKYLTDLAEHKDISTETILLNYNYKKNRTITVRLSNLTRGTITIPQKAIICEVQPVTIETQSTPSSDENIKLLEEVDIPKSDLNKEQLDSFTVIVPFSL